MLKVYDGSENYTATIIKVGFIEPINGMDRIVRTSFFGNDVVIDKKTEHGALGVYFDCGTILSEDFLRENNLFNKPKLNNDKTAKGFFEPSGRVKALKLAKGTVISTGFWIPITSLSYIKGYEKLKEGDSFNELNGEFICKKYIAPQKGSAFTQGKEKNEKLSEKFEKLLPNQFRLHLDTSHLGKNLEVLQEDSLIAITSKLHGTSFVGANVRVRRKMDWIDKILIKLGLGWRLVHSEFAHISASRKVIKTLEINSNAQHFYDTDIWSLVGEEVKDKIDNGVTLYGEIVGNLPTGSAIQGQYDYGCVGGEHAFYVYRITKTDESGTAFEYSWEQIKEYCVSRELKHVPEYYYGSLKDFYFRFVNPGNELSENFRDEIFKYLLTAFNLEKDCEFCRNVVPAEGIVVRVDGRKHYNAFKLKSKRFKLRENEELEAGVVDIESQE